MMLVSITVITACWSDSPINPFPSEPGIQPISLTWLSISPGDIEVNPGDSVQLTVAARDGLGQPIDVSGLVTYVSKHPEIAEVTKSGLVRAIAAGKATVSATVKGTATMTVTTSMYVHDTVGSKQVVFTAGANGWSPSFVDLAAGGSVQWHSGSIGWSGVPNSTIYLLDDDYSVVGSVDLVGGSATRTFATKGVVHFCSGGCWDPPDFGRIVVH